MEEVDVFSQVFLTLGQVRSTLCGQRQGSFAPGMVPIPTGVHHSRYTRLRRSGKYLFVIIPTYAQ